MWVMVAIVLVLLIVERLADDDINNLDNFF